MKETIIQIIVNRHGDKVLSSVRDELDYLDKNDLLKHIYSFYKKVESNPELRGDKNEPQSQIAFLLGFTSAKPTAPFSLSKRRMYARSGFPDIDMDIDHSKKNEVVRYMKAKYGEEYVSTIGTVQKLKTKAVIHRVVKAIDPDNNTSYDKYGKLINGKDDEKATIRLGHQISESLPELMKRADGTFVQNATEAYEEYSEFGRYMDEYPGVYDVIQHLEGTISAYGAHAGGVVVSSVPLAGICPLHVTKRPSKGSKEDRVIATQFSMNEVESLGLIKFDVLGLSTKTAISRTHDLIFTRYGVDVDLSALDVKDSATLALLNSGKTDGCFQLEGTGMKQALKQIGIKSFDDLVATIAMYRPGPMDHIPEFAQRKKGLKRAVYAHPSMEKITKRTFGIICYQEQTMQVFMDLAGLGPTEGYHFLKGCAKKKPKIINEYEIKFKRGCAERGVSENVISKVWSDLKKFSGYAFNKSHSVSYAYESFKTAYLKSHYPMEFFASRISVEAERRKFEQVEKYENDAQNNYGVKFLNPDLDRSKMYYTIIGEREILRPLLIKGIGDKAAQEIIDNQPYDGGDKLLSLTMKTDSAVNSRVIEALYEVGMLGKDLKKSQVLKNFEQIRSDKKKGKGRQQGDLFE